MDGLVFGQGRIHIVVDLIWIVVFVYHLKKEAIEATYAWRGHDQCSDAVDIASDTFGQIDNVVLVLKVVVHGVAMTVSALDETVELDLRLMIGNRGVLGAL